MALDQQTVRRIAYLARIRVKEDGLEKIASELEEIINWVKQLEEVDTTDIEPMNSVNGSASDFRNDMVNEGGCRDDLLFNAPHSEDGFFTVPKVVE